MSKKPLSQRQVNVREQLRAFAALGYLTWEPINNTFVSITPVGGVPLHGARGRTDGLEIHEAELYVSGLATGARGRPVTERQPEPLDTTTASVSDPADVSARPEDVCGCGYTLIWVEGEWQHDAAPSLWGDDHDADAPEPTGPAREHWDRIDFVTEDVA